MEQQKPFDFDPNEHHRSDDLSTSVAAAYSVQKSAENLMAQYLGVLLANGPSTFSELARHLRCDPGMVWKRLSDLKNKGMIEPSGVTRPGPSGRQQTVWRVVARG